MPRVLKWREIPSSSRSSREGEHRARGRHCQRRANAYRLTQRGIEQHLRHQVGALVVAEAIRRAGIPKEAVDEVIMGNVIAAGLGQAPARQASIYAGLPEKVEALTINKMCGSGLKAAMLGAQAIMCGDADIVVAGGMENMTQAPYLLDKARVRAIVWGMANCSIACCEMA